MCEDARYNGLRSPVGMKRLRNFFESIVFAGMKPGSSAAKTDGMRWLGPLRGPIERFLSGGAAPTDPLYLTNRTLGQRARLAAVVAVPLVLVLAAIYFATTGYLTPAEAPQQQLTPAQIAQKMLPNLDKNLEIKSNHELDVTDVHVEHGSPLKLAGVLKNNTGRAIRDAQLVFDVTDEAGSRLGAVSTTVERVDAKSSAPFSFSIPQPNAAFALVREVNSR